MPYPPGWRCDSASASSTRGGMHAMGKSTSQENAFLLTSHARAHSSRRTRRAARAAADPHHAHAAVSALESPSLFKCPPTVPVAGRGGARSLHSSTFQLNVVSIVCGLHASTFRLVLCAMLCCAMLSNVSGEAEKWTLDVALVTKQG